MLMRLTAEMADRIGTHGAGTYPHECCGALLGRDGAGGREVTDLLPLVNRRGDSPQNRFVITPDDVRRAERAAREHGVDVIGWYHSHPDHPARPSDFDREHAWPYYSYVIVSVERGEPRALASFRLSDDRARFSCETMEVAAWATPGPAVTPWWVRPHANEQRPGGR